MTLMCGVEIQLVMRDGETYKEAEKRISDVLYTQLCQLADHHIDFWMNSCEVSE